MFRLAPLMLVACESGVWFDAAVTVPAEVAESYDPAAPGILRLGLGATLFDLAPVCGDALPDPVTLDYDFGFGCLDGWRERQDPLLAWIEPAPAAWEADAVCALARSEEGLLDLSAFPEATRAEAPDPAWPQGEGTVAWKRDVSPCGGRGDGVVVIE